MAHDHHRTCQHKNYFLTCEDFDALYTRSAGECEMCGVPEAETKAQRLAMDHDHKFGRHAVRGLLCDSCNQLLDAMDWKRTYTEVAQRYVDGAWHVA